MKKIRLLLLSVVVLVALVSSVLAADGVDYLGETSDGTWYYELGDMGTSKLGVVYQEIYCQIALNDIGRQSFNTTGRFARILYLVDCSGRRFTAVGSAFFDASGNKIGGVPVQREGWRWENITPGSIAEQMEAVSCKIDAGAKV